MNIDLAILISLIGVCLSVATFFIGRQTAAKSDGKEQGAWAADIQYLKIGMDDIKKDIKGYQNQQTDVLLKIATIEASTKSAHKRLDSFERQLNLKSVHTEEEA